MGAYEAVVEIEAMVDIKPNTLNLKSKGRWVTAYLRLPSDYSVDMVELESLLLEGHISPERVHVDVEDQVVKLKFGRREVQALVSVPEALLTLTGELTSGITFTGSDAIRVIDRGKKNRPVRSRNRLLKPAQ
jgi:hypothetical protein